METYDDVFFIHKQTLLYLNKLKAEKENWVKEQNELIDKLLSSNIPHGFTVNDWSTIAIKYNRYSQSVVSTKNKITYKEAKDIIKKVEEIDEQITLEIHSTSYEVAAKIILDEYKKLITNVIHTDFMSLGKRKEMTPEQKDLKDKLIKLIEEVVGVDALQKLVKRKTSSVGSLKLDDLRTTSSIDIDENDDEWNGMVYNDINRINFAQKFKYDKRTHFQETIKQYQGLQNRVIPTEVIHNVIDMIEKHGLCDKSKDIPQEKYAKVKKEHIHMFLGESNHPEYYEDRQLIWSKITGYPCPNIQKYEKGLYTDFEQLVEVFLSFPEDVVDRKNFLNTHYVLRQLLLKRGIIVPEDDLNNLKTPARQRAHDDIYQMCCEKLEWNFTPLAS